MVYREELAYVRRLVLEGGKMLLESMDNVGPVVAKTATEIVTELDSRVEEMLLDGLSRQFPDDSFVAEESGNTDRISGRTWYIDPIDGTTNYAHGHPFFAISVGCATDNGLITGTVFAPYLDELYQAALDDGASLERTRTGEKRTISVSQTADIDQALLATGFPYVRDEGVDFITDLVGRFLKAKCHGVRRGGSAAVDLVHVAAGKLDGYWEKSLRPWDSAAGTIIAREAGATVSDFSGRQEALHYKSVLAAGPLLHTKMLAEINRYADTSGDTSCDTSGVIPGDS